MSIICPNWITGYTLVTVMDFHFVQNNFNSLFYCGCEISHEEKAGRKAVKTEILHLFVFGQMDSEIHLTMIFQED